MQVKNEECLLLLATYTKYSRKTHSQTFSTTQVGQPPSNLPSKTKSLDIHENVTNMRNYIELNR